MPGPPSRFEGLTIPHYRPASLGLENPFALAIWVGAWTVGNRMDRRYRVCAGRLWVLAGRLGLDHGDNEATERGGDSQVDRRI